MDRRKFNSLEEVVTEATDGVKFPQENENIKYVLWGDKHSFGWELVLFKKILTGPKEVIFLPMMRALPQYNIVMGYKKGSMVLKHKRRKKRFTLIKLNERFPTGAALDTALPGMMWKEIEAARKNKLLNEDYREWEELFLELSESKGQKES